ncbi:MAG: BrnA antitoxin family protein [Bacteriovoracales bacterium]|nr:BrnA antitoxin family protein [Bacteriovoracales bacterium]
MKKEYDFEKMKFKRNPYAKKLKKQITIRLDQNVIRYFQEMSEETDIPYQTLINFYLRDCVYLKKRPITKWKKAS